jgi:hypothetical protein
MLDGIKRLFTGAAAADPAWPAVAAWAQARQYTYRVVQNEGFVIDGNQGNTAWRLEWGPSQRPYIQGGELRLRSELGLGPELQALLMNRALQEHMEKTVFDQYVEGVQTRIDNQTPPEMRWLVMFPKLAGNEMPELRERFVAVGSIKSWLLQWLKGPLSQSLANIALEPLTPVVLMIGRGRLMLRTPAAQPDVKLMTDWLQVFEAAITQAQRVARDDPDTVSSTKAGAPWSTSALPGDERSR